MFQFKLIHDLSLLITKYKFMFICCSSSCMGISG